MTESSTKRIVFFYPEKYTLPLADDKSILLDHIQLKPGSNTVTLEQYELIRAHPDFVFWSQQGAFVATRTATGEPQESELIPEPEPTPTPEPVPTPTPEPVPTPTPTPENMPNPEGLETTQITVSPGLKVLVLPVGDPTPQGTMTITVSPGLKVLVLPVGQTLTPTSPESETVTNEELQPGTALGIKPKTETSEVTATGYALPDIEMSPEVTLEVGSGEIDETLPKLAPDAPLPPRPTGIPASNATKILSTDVAKKYPKST